MHHFLEEQRRDPVELPVGPFREIAPGASLAQDPQAFVGPFRWSEAFLLENVHAQVRVGVGIEEERNFRLNLGW